MQGALPGGDVVVHVEPAGEEALLRERVREAAMSVARVREIHNLSVIELPDGVHVSLHLKLPGELPLDQAHALAEEVERAIVEGVPEVSRCRPISSRSRSLRRATRSMTTPPRSSASCSR